MNIWLKNYFSNYIAKKISRDKELKKLLIRGIDVEGKLFVTNKNAEYIYFIDFIKNNYGMVIEYSSTLLAFFSERLYCESVSDAIRNCYTYLEDKKIPYGEAQGEILIGNLNGDQPIIAGMIITEATKKLYGRSNSK